MLCSRVSELSAIHPIQPCNYPALTHPFNPPTPPNQPIQPTHPTHPSTHHPTHHPTHPPSNLPSNSPIQPTIQPTKPTHLIHSYNPPNQLIQSTHTTHPYNPIYNPPIQPTIQSTKHPAQSPTLFPQHHSTLQTNLPIQATNLTPNPSTHQLKRHRSIHQSTSLV